MTTVAKNESTEHAHDDGEQQGYYRSQAEVDLAFGKRLAHERAKWEKTQKEVHGEEGADTGAQADGAQADGASHAPDAPDTRSHGEGLEEQIALAIEAMAGHEQQAPLEGAYPSEMIERATDAAIRNDAHAAFLVDIAQQAEALSRETDFDLAREMENPVFAMLLATGAPLRDVMEYVHPEQKATRLRADAEREVVERIRARNRRPMPLEKANASRTQLDVGALSDEQIREIDRRVKRGERVVL